VIRTPLIKLLQQYTPTEEESSHCKEILQFVQAHPHCFLRSLEVGHITSSAWLLNKTGSHALLLHHKKLDSWLQLGGHCDGESDVLAVAIKEAQEESGILGILPVSEDIFDVDIHYIPPYNGTKEHWHYDVRFLLQVTSDEHLKLNEEANALRWISKNKEDLYALSKSRSLERMWEKWVSYQAEDL
jgi:8-oxo-dGTP pyrophosphatase MutT (NUDIX family)